MSNIKLALRTARTETEGGEKQAEVMCMDQSHWVTESTEMGEKSRPPPKKKPIFKIKVENGQRKNREGADF